VKKLTPAQIQRSLSPDALMSFEDGRSYKRLKAHLARLGLSPEAYREKWGLPRDYPMVAQAYSDQNSKRARGRGFGQKHGAASAQVSETGDE
jgi:predicted transcriptional regulator